MKKKVILAVPLPIEIETSESPSSLGACSKTGHCYWGKLMKTQVWRWTYAKACPKSFTHWLPAYSPALPTKAIDSPKRVFSIPIRHR